MSRFVAYATSVAFNISLSKAQVKTLNAISCINKLAFPAHSITIHALFHKGLIDRRADGDYEISQEGKLLLPLLRLCGLLEKGISIGSVVRAMEQKYGNQEESGT